jgi:alkylation response protein AidB-like acyl-CoA dehydrogenase
LRTRAVRKEGVWLIDGQKVWSSFATKASFGLLLARTSASAVKPQAGITMFILPMDATGVVVRPLVDIAGGRHFNEVFLSAVVHPDDQVLGPVDGGWAVATGTLGGERAAYMGGSGGGRRKRQVLKALARRQASSDPVLRQRAVSVIAEEWLLERLRDRLFAGTIVAGHPASGSLMKLAAGTLEQRVAQLVCDLDGPASIAWPSCCRDGDVPAHALAASRQATIAGGTHQIQRNLIAERILGLPR